MKEIRQNGETILESDDNSIPMILKSDREKQQG